MSKKFTYSDIIVKVPLSPNIIKMVKDKSTFMLYINNVLSINNTKILNIPPVWASML